MVQHDWLDDLRWRAIVLGCAITLALQVVLALLVFRPLGLSISWAAVVLVESCVAAGALVAAWRVPRAALINGVAVALVSACISLGATLLRTPAQLTPASGLFLFASFGAMGVLGGALARQMRGGRDAKEPQ